MRISRPTALRALRIWRSRCANESDNANQFEDGDSQEGADRGKPARPCLEKSDTQHQVTSVAPRAPGTGKGKADVVGTLQFIPGVGHSFPSAQVLIFKSLILIALKLSYILLEVAT